MSDSTNPKDITEPVQGEENLAPPTGYATVTERRFDGSFISGAGNDIFYFNDSFVYGVGDVRGDDFYVIGQYQIGNINLNDVTGDNRVYFDDNFVINYARASGQGLILGYDNGDGGYSELRVRDANTRYKFYLGNNDTALTVTQLIAQVGVTHAPVGTPTKTLTAGGIFDVEDDSLITASTDFGVTLLGGTGLDVFTLGFSQNGTLNGRAGADYYYLTRFQESTSLNLRDTEGSNHFIVEGGVAIADVDDSGEAIILDLANGGKIQIAGGLTKYSFHIGDFGQGTVTGTEFLNAYDNGVGLTLSLATDDPLTVDDADANNTITGNAEEIDIFSVSDTSLVNRVNFATNVANIGGTIYTLKHIDGYIGGSGADTVIVGVGTWAIASGGDSLTITDDTIVDNSVTYTISNVETLSGSSGVEVFKLASVIADFTIDGSTGDDTLDFATAGTYDLATAGEVKVDSVTMNVANIEALNFSGPGIQVVKGGANTSFTTINGGLGTDTLEITGIASGTGFAISNNSILTGTNTYSNFETLKVTDSTTDYRYELVSAGVKLAISDAGSSADILALVEDNYTYTHSNKTVAGEELVGGQSTLITGLNGIDTISLESNLTGNLTFAELNNGDVAFLGFDKATFATTVTSATLTTDSSNRFVLTNGGASTTFTANTLELSGGSDTLTVSTTENIIIDGGMGTDTILGTDVDLSLYTSFENAMGTAGNDTLKGDNNNNSLAGNAGNDRFIASAGMDTITDFATGDVLDFSRSGFGIDDIDDLKFTASGNDIRVIFETVAGTHTTTLQGTAAATAVTTITNMSGGFNDDNARAYFSTATAINLFNVFDASKFNNGDSVTGTENITNIIDISGQTEIVRINLSADPAILGGINIVENLAFYGSTSLNLVRIDGVYTGNKDDHIRVNDTTANIVDGNAGSDSVYFGAGTYTIAGKADGFIISSPRTIMSVDTTITHTIRNVETVIGSDSNDSFDLSGLTLTSTATITIDGGDGTDSVSVGGTWSVAGMDDNFTISNDSVIHTVKNVENLNGSSGDDEFRITAVIADLKIDAGTGTSDTLTITEGTAHSVSTYITENIANFEVLAFSDDGNRITVDMDTTFTLDGGEGTDTIIGTNIDLSVHKNFEIAMGTDGNDTLKGGAGDDTFIASKGSDTISDFDTAGSDVLDVGAVGITNINQLTFSDSGNNIQVIFEDKDDSSMSHTTTLQGTAVTTAVTAIKDLDTANGMFLQNNAETYFSTGNPGEGLIVTPPPPPRFQLNDGTMNLGVNVEIQENHGSFVYTIVIADDVFDTNEGLTYKSVVGAYDYNNYHFALLTNPNGDILVSYSHITNVFSLDYESTINANKNTPFAGTTFKSFEFEIAITGMKNMMAHTETATFTFTATDDPTDNAPAEEHYAYLSQNYELGFNGDDRDIVFETNDSLYFTNDDETLNRDELWQALSQDNLDISHSVGDIHVSFGKADWTFSKADGSNFLNQFGSDNQVDSLAELDAFITLLNVDIA